MAPTGRTQLSPPSPFYCSGLKLKTGIAFRVAEVLQPRSAYLCCFSHAPLRSTILPFSRLQIPASSDRPVLIVSFLSTATWTCDFLKCRMSSKACLLTLLAFFCITLTSLSTAATIDLSDSVRETPQQDSHQGQTKRSSKEPVEHLPSPAPLVHQISSSVPTSVRRPLPTIGPSSASTRENECERAFTPWSPWTEKGENIKNNRCGPRRRTRKILNETIVQMCYGDEAELAQYKEFCKYSVHCKFTTNHAY